MPPIITNFVVDALVMKVGADMEFDVFYTMLANNLVISLLLWI